MGITYSLIDFLPNNAYNTDMDNRSVRYHLDRRMAEPKQFGDIFLVQIGRLYCGAGQIIGKHPHRNWYELTIATGGEGEVLTFDVPTRVKKGVGYLSYPGDAHEIRSSESNPLEYTFFSFYTTDEKLKSDLELISQNYASPLNRTFESERIHTLVLDALAEFDSTDTPYSNLLLQHIFGQILIYIVREFSELNKKSELKNVSDAEMFCYRITNYIDTHIYSLKSLSELAAYTNYNYCYLSRLYKKITKNTLEDYYRKKRLDTACLLIKENKLKMTEIAELLNFSSVYTFSKSFKSAFGISPKEYGKKK